MSVTVILVFYAILESRNLKFILFLFLRSSLTKLLPPSSLKCYHHKESKVPYGKCTRTSPSMHICLFLNQQKIRSHKECLKIHIHSYRVGQCFRILQQCDGKMRSRHKLYLPFPANALRLIKKEFHKLIQLSVLKYLPREWSL